MKTVGELKDSIAGLISGTSLKNITGINSVIERAVRLVIQNADVASSQQKDNYTLYDGVDTYESPSAIFGGALIDLRPQGASRTSIDYTYKKPIAEWDRTKALLPNGYSVSFEFDKGTGIMRIASPKPTPRITLDTCTSTTGWTIGGDASSLAQDQTVYYKQPAALRFNLDSAGNNGYIERTLTNKDLTDYEGVGVVFVAVRIPDADAVTNVGVRLGSDSDNYFYVTNTQGFLGAWKVGEWTLIALDLADATEEGTVDIDNVDYLRIYVDYDGTAMSNFYIGGCWISLPSPHELLYYSTAVFLDTSDDLSKTITNDNDRIVFNDAAYTLLEYQAAIVALLQNGGNVSEGLAGTYHSLLHGSGDNDPNALYNRYKADNPSQELRTVGNWYLD